jgi:hypothetical protein
VTRLTALRRRLGIAPAAAAADHFPRTRTKIVTETFSSGTAVPTASGSRYLQQLCKHWAHNLTVEFTPEHGTVAFPRDVRGADYPGDALVTFDARAEALDVRIDATSPAQRDGLKGVVERHLDRFAFREAPLTFDWLDV